MVLIVEGLYPINDSQYPQSSDDEDAPRTEGALRPAALLRAQAAAREERRVAEDQAKARRDAELRAALKKEDAPLKKSNVMRRRASSSVILTPHGRARMAARDHRGRDPAGPAGWEDHARARWPGRRGAL